MALDLGTLRAGVEIDTRGVPRGLAMVRSKLQRFRQEQVQESDRSGHEQGSKLGAGMARGLGRSVGAVGKVLSVGALGVAGFAAAGVAALGAVGVAGAIAGTKVASGNQQAAISFTTMLGSAKKADAFLRDLQQFAATTPFEFPELQTAASSLISAGINADKVIPIMRTLGDVTSGMGTGAEGVQRATIALQQMSAAGRITGEDLNQLRDAGIPVFDLLASATGKSKAEVVKLAQAGKLGKKELDALMKGLESGKGLERFSGLMDKQSKSLAGMWSTLKDTVGQGLAGIMSNALPIMSDGLDMISATAARLFGWFHKNQDSVASVFDTGRESIKTFGRIVSAVFGAFIGSTGDGTKSFKQFAEYLETHQEDITRALLNGAGAAIGLGKSIATGASAGLRALGTLSDASVGMTTLMLAGFSAILHGMAETWGFIPGIGPKLKAADEQFASFSKNAVAGMKHIGPGARAAADTIDKHVTPALDAAQGKLDKIGNTEIAKAKLRDSAARAGQAIDEVGTRANGSQLKLKHFADMSKLSADEQAGLRKRVKDAAGSLREHLAAVQDAGGGQKALTAAWKTGKDRLYDEFKQMGLSNKEAKKLAERYAGVQPKVETKITTPGMDAARRKTQGLAGDIRNVKGKKVDLSVNFKMTAAKAAAEFFKNVPGSQASGFSQLPRGMKAGGPVQNLSGRARKGVDTEHVLAAYGEHVWTDREVDGAGGHGAVARLRKAALSGKLRGFKSGGGIERELSIHGQASGDTSQVSQYAGAAGGVESALADKIYRGAVAKAIAKANAAGAAGSPVSVGNPGGKTSFRGGTFSRLFAANLSRAEKIAHQVIRVFQGGWRHATSYSGTSHAGDAVDLQVSNPLIRALRSVKIAAGDRTGLGNWVGHVHAIPGPGAGYAHGSAVWQWGDYVRRGGAKQGLRSPWGLATGTGSGFAPMGFGWTAEKGAELVVNPQLRRYSGGEGVANADQTRKLLGMGGSRSLIGGDVNITVGAGASARDAVAELAFTVRNIEQGGPHARG